MQCFLTTAKTKRRDWSCDDY